MGLIANKLTEDLKAAMRSRDQVRLRTIRLLRAGLKSLEIDRRRGEEVTLSDEDELAVLQKQAKQRRESMVQFEEAGRQDLYEKEKEELSVIESYLPQMMSREEIRKLVSDAIARVGATSKADMGKVMGAVMPAVRGRADGNLVREAATELLSTEAI